MQRHSRAIFLGAGAAAAEGAPVQSQLFRAFFSSTGIASPGAAKIRQELRAFFDSFFSIDVESAEAVLFPTFEEALGLVDIAEVRKDGFRDFPLDDNEVQPGRLRSIRQYLVLLMASVIHEHLQTAKGVHRRLVENLKRAEALQNCIFLTTNYDILLDNALLASHGIGDIDYGIEFAPILERPAHFNRRPGRNATKVFKLHGSLNWLYCPACRMLALTPEEKGAIRLIHDIERARCRRCRGILTAIVVPPTFFKDVSNLFLANLWYKAEHLLTGVDHLVFCGYSFPDADLHVKYMLKRVQVNSTRSMRVTVVNNHEGKASSLKIEESQRFSRFLGPSVNYTEMSFEEFADDPIAVL
jgi:NAD-dependent SIR2 family protein deacetylase